MSSEMRNGAEAEARDRRNGDGDGSAVAVLESALRQANDLIKANPTLAVLGVASATAIVVMALKSKSDAKSSNGNVGQEVRDFLSRHAPPTGDWSKQASALLASVPALDKETAAGLRDTAAEWFIAIQEMARQAANRARSSL